MSGSVTDRSHSANLAKRRTDRDFNILTNLQVQAWQQQDAGEGFSRTKLFDMRKSECTGLSSLWGRKLEEKSKVRYEGLSSKVFLRSVHVLQDERAALEAATDDMSQRTAKPLPVRKNEVAFKVGTVEQEYVPPNKKHALNRRWTTEVAFYRQADRVDPLTGLLRDRDVPVIADYDLNMKQPLYSSFTKDRIFHEPVIGRVKGPAPPQPLANPFRGISSSHIAPLQLPEHQHDMGEILIASSRQNPPSSDRSTGTGRMTVHAHHGERAPLPPEPPSPLQRRKQREQRQKEKKKKQQQQAARTALSTAIMSGAEEEEDGWGERTWGQQQQQGEGGG